MFLYNYKFRDRVDVRACCNIALGVGCNKSYSGADGRIFGMKTCKL